jgi:hypothetical protein
MAGARLEAPTREHGPFPFLSRRPRSRGQTFTRSNIELRIAGNDTGKAIRRALDMSRHAGDRAAGLGSRCSLCGHALYSRAVTAQSRGPVVVAS